MEHKNNSTLRQARYYAVQMAYAYRLNNNFTTELFWTMDGSEGASKSSKRHAETVFLHYQTHMEYCESIIAKYLGDSWTIDRIGFFERGLISSAIVEFLYMKTPMYAVFEEYVTVSASFCDTKTVDFINSILNKILKDFEKTT